MAILVELLSLTRPADSGGSETIVRVPRTISFNGVDWEDYMLVTVRMSVTWRARVMMPQFF